MKKSNLYVFAVLVGSMLIMQACGPEPDPVVPTPVVKAPTYTANVASILNESCALAGCHAAGASDGSLATYLEVKTFKHLAKLVKSIKREAGTVAMPIGADKLSDTKIATIETWIANGMPEK